MFMLKSISLFLIVLLVVLFSLSNAHHIPMKFIVGDAVDVRLIYLVIFSYLLGLLSATYFFVMLKLDAKRRRVRREQLLAESDDEEDEEEIG